MAFGFGKPRHREIGPAELDALLREDKVIIIDVREVDEFVTGHIPGALNFPLSDFQPSRLPDPEGKTLVLNCLGGKRSAMALEKCSVAQTAVDTHLAGGFAAWAAAGMPVER